MIRFLLTATFTLCLVFTNQAQHPIQNSLDSLYSSLNDQAQPGISIGIWKDGRVQMMTSYGLASIEHRVPTSSQTVSDIGSVAKQFTSFAILLLQDQGRLSLEDHITKYLDYIPAAALDIKIRHLVHHTSGLREVYATESIRGGRSGDAIFQRDVIELVKRHQDLNFPPGDRFMYCNTSYALLAEIVEKVGGQSFEKWMKEHIFNPLGMQHSYIMDQQGEVFPNTADSYYGNLENGYRKAFDNSTLRGQGGIYTTLEDMMKWLANFSSQQLGSPAVYEAFYTKGLLNNGDSLDYAGGLFIDEWKGIKRIRHGGASAGYRSSIVYYPSYDLGIFIKNNAPSIAIDDALKVITEHYLATHFQEEDSEKKEETPEDQEVAMPWTPVLQEYAGQYFSPELETTFSIQVAGEDLEISHFRNRAVKTQPAPKRDKFENRRIFLPEIQFIRNQQEQVVGFQVSTSRVRNIYFEKVNR